MQTTPFTIGPLGPEGPSRPLAVAASRRRPGWFRLLTAEPGDLEFIKAVPGPMLDPKDATAEPAILIPWNLLVARPDWFSLRPADDPVPELTLPEGLRAYQLECVRFAISRGGRGVYLGLDLGLGKTVTATAIAVVERHKRVVIVGPLISRGAWVGARSDPARWFGIEVTPLSGKKETIELARETMQQDGWVFVHYELLDAWKPWLLSWFRPTCVIFDELDYCRGYSSRVSRAARAVSRLSSVERRIGLSGTAVHNSVMDLWPQLDILEPDAWGWRSTFGTRYCGFHPGEYGLVAGEPTHVDEFKDRLKLVFVRRGRREVLAELPKITRQRLETTLDPEVMEEYARAEQDIRGYIQILGRGIAPGNSVILARLTTLMRLLALAKTKAAIELARKTVEAGEKIVVFTWFKESAQRIAAALRKYAGEPITGETPAQRRLDVARAFGEHSGPAVFVATIASAGVSLNGLQAASVVLISDLWWTLAKLLQGEGRVWRFGQRWPVMAYFGVATGTVDEELVETLLKKAESISASSEGKDSDALAGVLRSEETDELDLARFVEKLSERFAKWEAA